MTDRGGHSRRTQVLTLIGVLLLLAAVLAAGFVAAQVVQLTECRGDTSQQDITPGLERYCDEGWREIAIGWPGAFVAAGAIAAWITRRRWPLAVGAVVGAAAAVSPLVAVAILA